MHYAYHFRTASGSTCCASDDPKTLCGSCKARLSTVAAPRAAGSASPAALRTVEANTAPEPPDFGDFVRSTRAAQEALARGERSALTPEGRPISEPRTAATTRRSAERAPEPPDFINAVTTARQKETRDE